MPGFTEPKKSGDSEYSPCRWLAWGVLLIAVFVIAAVRIRLLDMPLERDEGEYAYLGQLIQEGVPPYALAGNMKLPGIYLAYAATMAVFGQTPAGIHLGLLIVNLAVLALLFLIARKFLDLYGAVIAAVAYGLMVLSNAYLGLAAHAGNYVMPFALLGMLVLFKIKKNGGLLLCLAAGALFGIGFVINQPGAAFGVFGGLYLAWKSTADKIARRQILLRLGACSLGCVAPFLAVCLWLKIAGAFPQFCFWLAYSRKYATALGFGDGLLNLSIELEQMFHFSLLLYVVALLGFICLWFAPFPPGKRAFLLGFLAFSLLAVCPGLYFRPHYFIFLAPALALLAGLAVSAAFRRLAQALHQPWVYHLSFLLVALICAQTLYVNRDVLFFLSPRAACRAVYEMNPFPESLDIARYIEKNSSPDQHIVVIGDEPQIYFYSHRRASISQIYPSQTMDPRPYAHKMQERMISELEQNPPAFLVYSSLYPSLLVRANSDLSLLNWTRNYVRQNMQLVGLIEFTGLQTTKTVWGPAAKTTPLSSPYFVLIYKSVQALHAPQPGGFPND